MKGRAKLCPQCWGEGVVIAPREQAILGGFLGAAKLPCPRCQMRGWIEESEIDCDTSHGW